MWPGLITLGYGKNLKDETMGNPQPSPGETNNQPVVGVCFMDAVQRLDVGGSDGEK